MRLKKILGFLILIIGVFSLFFSHYIESQVAEGKVKVSKAEKSVDNANSLFSFNPATKGIGKELTDSAQGKIDAGKEEIHKYEQMAQWMQIAGVVLVILGAGVVAMGFVRKKR